jgi:UDP-N-acetylglucosamine--N-acetylmuramyl-(pentapeptide) pyrophosphoryl-undecaprenol N-acetylglucosamine transferase
MSKSSRYKILITGGGTGGHVFPAIAIANAIKAIQPETEFLFVGAEGRLEMTKVPEAGYTIEGLNISGFQRDNLLKNISLPFKVIGSLLKANKLINKFQPDVVVGVGGYASGPTMFVAHQKNIPVLIQEQNSFAGVTNKMMKNKAQKFCVAYDGMEYFFPSGRIIKTGNPVRQMISEMKSNKEANRKTFDLVDNKLTVLVVGGSLGARTINESIGTGLQQLTQNNLQIIWQTGKPYFEKAQQQAEVFNNVKVFDFIKNMDEAYDVADIIISRAGAIAISELCLIGKPVVLVPSPNVAEDHQTKNALALVDKHAAVMVKDIDARNVLIDELLKLINNKEQQIILSKNILQLGIPNAADRIAKEVLKLING